jgi:hypothetical protein
MRAAMVIPILHSPFSILYGPQRGVTPFSMEKLIVLAPLFPHSPFSILRGVTTPTSRKHGKKKLQSFVHCSSFAITKGLQIFLFCFTTSILKFGGHVIHRWKGILEAPKFLTIQLVNQKKKNCSRLMSADQGGQKNRNGQTIAFLFYHIFY